MHFPFHLLLPLLASILFVCGLLFTKRAAQAGVNPWTVTFLANFWSTITFSSLWILGGTMQPWFMLWQPAVIAILYMLGLVFTFSAIEHGDVSVATPVFGIKVLIVAILVTLFGGEILPALVWYAAGLAVLGIALIQWTGYGTHRRRILFTLLFASLAACSFATFDVLVQKWAPAWGPGRFLPCVYWIVGLLSLGFLPAVQFDLLKNKEIRTSLIAGTILIALQAMCIVFTLSAFGDATRVNVVYATRGLWGVLLAWMVAKKWGGAEAKLPQKLMWIRLTGAIILTTAVIIALCA